MIFIDDYSENNYKVAGLLAKYGLIDKSIFFIDFRDGNAGAQIKILSDFGFDIGSHTITHSHLTKISNEQIEWELKQSKEAIEEITGKECEAFVYPRGYYTPEIIEMVKNSGYKWARTTLLQDGKTEFEKGGNHLSYPRSEYGGIDPFEWAKTSTLNHYWLHAFEVERYNLMDKLEEFLKWLTKK